MRTEDLEGSSKHKEKEAFKMVFRIEPVTKIVAKGSGQGVP